MNVERHHLGDFLPPDELARFMGKCKASVDPSKSEVDKSDYVENKLGEDNKGRKLEDSFKEAIYVRRSCPYRVSTVTQNGVERWKWFRF